ncbi:MAG: M14 family metallocarboxypeptidase [Rubritalea sp.]|uniref:M14 family metallopeptidase n=1 Tax=Rubritalea sp. TaxID=2109375 RepID=UPI003242FCD3
MMWRNHWNFGVDRTFGCGSLVGMEVKELIEACDRELQAMGAQRELLCEVEGFPIYGYTLMRRMSERTVYLSSGIHGDEPAGPLALLELLKERVLNESCSWYVCPILNPTGLQAGTRENYQGFDLNRDYLNCKSFEVASHAKWIEGIKCDFAISLHEDWESSGFYFYEINQLEDRPQRYARMVEALAPTMPMEPESLIDDHEVREAGWIYHGSEPDEPKHWPEAIFLAVQGCPLSFTFETPSSLELSLRVKAHKVAVCAALRICI